MANLVSSLFVKLTANTTGFQSNMQKAERRVQSTARQMDRATRSVKRLAGTFAAGIGAASIVREMVTVTAGFQESMNKVSALTGAVGDDFSALSKQAQQLGSTTKFSAREAADAMGFLAMAGFDVNQIMGAMPSTLQLAAAANMDLARAADITSNVLTGYGLDVSELAKTNDVLTKAFVSSNTDLEMLGASFTKVGPIAKALNLSLEETVATLGQLAQGGIRGEEAGTALRNVLVSLAAPTGAARASIKRLGLTLEDSRGDFIGFANVLGQLEEAQKRFSSTEFTQLLNDIFSKRGVAPLNVLLSQSTESLNEFKAALENSAGTAQEIADKQMEGLSGAFLEAKSAWEGLVLAITGPDSANSISTAIEGIVDDTRDSLSDLTEQLKDTESALNKVIEAAQTMYNFTPMSHGARLSDFIQSSYGRVKNLLSGGDEQDPNTYSPLPLGLGSISEFDPTVDPARSGKPPASDTILAASSAVDTSLRANESVAAFLDGMADVESGLRDINIAADGVTATTLEFTNLSGPLKELAFDGFGSVKTVIAEAAEQVSSWQYDIAEGVTTMAGAIEDGMVNAAMQGKAAFGDMAEFILAEINRILIRSLVLRPLFGGIGGFLSGAGFDVVGGAFSSAFGAPGRAAGGPVSEGRSYIVGEHGPELLTMGGNGVVTPNSQMGGAGIIIEYLDTRGADAAAVARLERALVQVNASVEKRAIGAVSNQFRRNPKFGER